MISVFGTADGVLGTDKDDSKGQTATGRYYRDLLTGFKHCRKLTKGVHLLQCNASMMCAAALGYEIVLLYSPALAPSDCMESVSRMTMR